MTLTTVSYDKKRYLKFECKVFAITVSAF